MIRLNLHIEGIVQGVGFRPFVYRLAKENSLGGWVLNHSQGVQVEVEGESKAVDRLLNSLTADAPPLSRITKLEKNSVPPTGESEFTIRRSRTLSAQWTLISPDTDVCADCLTELFDPKDRRYRYPFINCTNCGPRFTIIEGIPYDRGMTTMRVFEMCPLCQEECEDPANRRFHAQPNGCWQCGPRLSFLGGSGEEIQIQDPLQAAIHRLKEGSVVAIKGLGGFHLAVDATSERAVARLRERKHREEKPFALMVGNIEKATEFCEVGEEEKALLTSQEKPILLLKKRPSTEIAESVAPHNRFYGIMLPYTPVHHLLLASDLEALVMTSGNVSEEPIVKDNEEALERLEGIADYFLVHNRDIHIRADDSIARAVSGKGAIIRRSRGMVPRPIPLKEDGPEILALGGELKNTICLTRGGQAFVSQYVGDMENAVTYRIFLESITHLKRLLDVTPEVIAYDLHPDYLATRYALEQEGFTRVGVQHHFAHVASCMAENAVEERVIGVAFDGTGYGDDGTIWGGEFLLCDYSGYTRKAHFNYVPMPGGSAAIREPYRMALSYLYQAFGPKLFDLSLPLLRRRKKGEVETLIAIMEKGINTPPTSSCGRLFDAIAAILDVREKITFEGQAPMELEMLIQKDNGKHYDFLIVKDGDTFRVCFEPLVRSVAEDLVRGEDRATISVQFHNTIAKVIEKVCELIGSEVGLDCVALSGGVFQNLYLMEKVEDGLQRLGFRVLTHHIVPCNDGGISFGQAVIARRATRRQSGSHS